VNPVGKDSLCPLCASTGVVGESVCDFCGRPAEGEACWRVACQTSLLARRVAKPVEAKPEPPTYANNYYPHHSHSHRFTDSRSSSVSERWVNGAWEKIH
jgi:hypothetical protein